MSETEKKSLFSRLNRTLVLAILGVVTVGTGTLLGLWMTAVEPDNDEGNPASQSESLAGGLRKKHGVREAEPKEFQSLLTENELDFVTDAGAWNETASRTDRIANHVANGDNALRIGDYARAISDYRYVLDMTDGAAEASVRFRLALSSECSGAIQEALDQYQAIAQKFSQSNWNDVAQLGRTRCLAATGQADVLSSVVYRNLILDDTALTPPVQRELLHVAARGLCRTLLGKRRNDILSPQTLVLSASDTDPNRELAQLPELVGAEPVPAGAPAFERLQKIGDHPDDIYFKVHTKHASLQTLLTNLTKQAELQLRLSPGAVDAIDSRRQAIHADDIRMSLLLDGLCVPFGLVWHSEKDQVLLSAASEVSAEQNTEFQFDCVDRILMTARIEAPNSVQAAHTQIAHGCLLFENGRVANAAHVFQSQLNSGTAVELNIEAAFNLGKCYQALGQLEKAEEAWYRCVDAGGRDRATLGAAYICIGRLQLEDARFQKAATSLGRGLDISDGTPLEQQAAAMLGSAYLMAGNPPAGNTAMFEHKDSIDDIHVEKAVAFASALARFRVAGLEKRREFEARSVVSALSHFNPSTGFGGHWHVLAAQACDELGLTEAALQHYVDSIGALSDGGLKKAAMMRLAARYRDEQRLGDAAKLLKAAQAAESDSKTQVAYEVALQAADVALRSGKPQLAIKQSREIAIQTENEALRRRALRLMGRAHENRGEYEAAVYCFAGMLPRENQDSAIVPASHGKLE